MFFLRLDYIHCGSPVQRVRRLCSSMRFVLCELSQFCSDDYTILQVKVERCV